MWKHADTPKLDVTPLIEPCPTEPYYTMWVWHVQECKCTQVRWTPQSEPSSTHPATPYEFDMWTHTYEPRCNTPSQTNPVQHTPTMPCPFDMRKHADIPKWDVSPQWNPGLQSPTTLCPFDMKKHAHADISKWDVSLPNWTQLFKTLLHHVHLTCGSM